LDCPFDTGERPSGHSLRIRPLCRQGGRGSPLPDGARIVGSPSGDSQTEDLASSLPRGEEERRGEESGPLGEGPSLSMSSVPLGIDPPRVRVIRGSPEARKELLDGTLEEVSGKLMSWETWEPPVQYELAGETNSGKSDFVLRLLEKLSKAGIKGVVLVPRRALAQQMCRALTRKGLPVRGRFHDQGRCCTRDSRDPPRGGSGATMGTILVCVFKCAPEGRTLENSVVVIDETEELLSSQGQEALSYAELGLGALEESESHWRARGVFFCGPNDGSISGILSGCGFGATKIVFERLSDLRLLEKGVRASELRARDAIFVPSMKKLDLLARKLQQDRRDLSLGYIYGTQSEEDREMTLGRFASGELAVLLVTSCVSFGVNLEVKRMLFYEAQGPRGGRPEDHLAHQVLRPREARQIAGRAGRGVTKGEVGIFLTLGSKTWEESQADLRRALEEAAAPLQFQRGTAPDLVEELTSVLASYPEPEKEKSQDRSKRAPGEAPEGAPGEAPGGASEGSEAARPDPGKRRSEEFEAAHLTLELVKDLRRLPGCQEVRPAAGAPSPEGEGTQAPEWYLELGPEQASLSASRYLRIFRLVGEASARSRASIPTGGEELCDLVRRYRLLGSLGGALQKGSHTDLHGAREDILGKALRALSRSIGDLLP